MIEAYLQLTRCGALAYMREVSIVDQTVYAKVDLAIIDVLTQHPQFLSGPWYRMHRDVNRDGIRDTDSCEFRSIRGSFGKGSVQIVINRPTQSLEADVDRLSPYDDAVGAVGHLFGEVIPGVIAGWFRRKRKTQTEDSDRV